MAHSISRQMSEPEMIADFFFVDGQRHTENTNNRAWYDENGSSSACHDENGSSSACFDES